MSLIEFLAPIQLRAIQLLIRLLKQSPDISGYLILKPNIFWNMLTATPYIESITNLGSIIPITFIFAARFIKQISLIFQDLR